MQRARSSGWNSNESDLRRALGIAIRDLETSAYRAAAIAGSPEGRLQFGGALARTRRD